MARRVNALQRVVSVVNIAPRNRDTVIRNKTGYRVLRQSVAFGGERLHHRFREGFAVRGNLSALVVTQQKLDRATYLDEVKRRLVEMGELIEGLERILEREMPTVSFSQNTP